MGNFKMTQLITTFITTILISSCNSYDQKDFEFNSKDRMHISSFKVGDTIHYESSLGDIDTIIIYKIDSIQNKKWGTLTENCINVTIKYLPNDTLWTWKSFNNNDGVTELIYQDLIRICKQPERKKTIYSINFQDFSSEYDNDKIGSYHTDTIKINNKVISNYFEIKSEYSKQTNIELIYWTDKDGLIAYKKRNGNWWTKKSSP